MKIIILLIILSFSVFLNTHIKYQNSNIEYIKREVANYLIKRKVIKNKAETSLVIIELIKRCFKYWLQQSLDII